MAGLPPKLPHTSVVPLYLPARKKGGGHRPIAVGEVLRRLTSKCLSRSVQKEALQTLTPLQVGVGVKGGCEAIVHAVSRTLEDPNIPPEEQWTLLLDFSNAFNSVSRVCMFEEIRSPHSCHLCLDGKLLWCPANTTLWGRVHPELLWSPTRRPFGPLRLCPYPTAHRRTYQGGSA